LIVPRPPARSMTTCGRPLREDGCPETRVIDFAARASMSSQPSSGRCRAALDDLAGRSVQTTLAG
jgi:hypothetical protein